MPRQYRRNMPHKFYSERRLDLVAGELRLVLALPCTPDETLAAAGRPVPDGDDWRAWGWVLPRVAARLNARLGRGGRLGQISAACWRLHDRGEVDVVAVPMRTRRGRVLFVRPRPPGSDPACSPVPEPAPGGGSGHYSRGLLLLASRFLVEVLAEPCPRLEFLTATSRQPPGGAAWRPWPWCVSRFLTRTRRVLPGTDLRLPSAAAWQLADEGRVQVASTPMRGARGRLRFARLAPPGEAP